MKIIIECKNKRYVEYIKSEVLMMVQEFQRQMDKDGSDAEIKTSFEE